MNPTLDFFYSMLGEQLESLGPDSEFGPEFMGMLFGSFGLIGVGLLLFFVATLAAKLAVTYLVSNEMTGRSVTWQEALGVAVGIKFWRAVGQVLLEALAITGVILIPYLVIVFSAVQQMTLGVLIGVVLLLGLGCAAIYLGIRWSLTIPAIANEEVGVLDSFWRSSRLVSGSWWRVFGILLLFSVILQFASSMVTTPLAIVAMWDFYSAIFQSIGSQGEPDPAVMVHAMKSVGAGVGVVLCVDAILTALVKPVYTAMVYFDLRARQGEFLPPHVPAEPRAPIPPSVPPPWPDHDRT
jgi:hypothetical protein